MNQKAPSGDSTWLGLAGQVGVVTGAAGGIGQVIARELAAVGATVALLDRDEAAVAALAEEIAGTGGKALGLQGDVTKLESVARASADLAAKLGRCDFLVNNAAAIYADALMQVKVDKWNELMAVNVTGYLLCAQAFGRLMIDGRRGGSMVHIASISGTVPQPYSGAYSVSKAGVKMLSQLLAVELGEHRIRSNVVSPAMVRTPMSESIYKDETVLRRREEIVPARRISEPRDIADAVVFLVSERSSYINGQEVLVDGGLSQAFLTLIPRPGFEKSDAQ